jgi:inosine-uridine nucleoside N-ribohydrolase
MAIPVLLDCDPGHDDALAILLAAASPAIDLLGITTVAGNQTLPKTTLTGRQPNARVATSLDVDRFWQLIVTAVAALG